MCPDALEKGNFFANKPRENIGNSYESSAERRGSVHLTEQSRYGMATSSLTSKPTGQVRKSSAARRDPVSSDFNRAPVNT